MPMPKRIKREARRRFYKCPKCGVVVVYFGRDYTAPCPTEVEDEHPCGGTMFEVDP